MTTLAEIRRDLGASEDRRRRCTRLRQNRGTMRRMTWTDPPDQRLLREWEYLYARGELEAGRTATYSRGEPGTPGDPRRRKRCAEVTPKGTLNGRGFRW